MPWRKQINHSTPKHLYSACNAIVVNEPFDLYTEERDCWNIHQSPMHLTAATKPMTNRDKPSPKPSFDVIRCGETGYEQDKECLSNVVGGREVARSHQLVGGVHPESTPMHAHIV